MAVVILIIGLVALALQAYLTMKGFGPPCPPDDFVSMHEEERVLLAPPATVLEAYGRAAAQTGGMRVYATGSNCLFIDSRPSFLVLDGDYGSTIRVLVSPTENGASAVRVESVPKTPWVATIGRVGAAFVAKERALRMNTKRLSGISESL